MVKLPKRRKDKYNPYTLSYIESNNTYWVSFVDNNKVKQTIELDETLFSLFNSFELEDKSQMNKFDKYIEHSEVYEDTLYKRSVKDTFCLENKIIKDIEIEELKRAINSLPDIQKRRIKMYYFEDMNLEAIAKLEKCTHQNVSKSISRGIKKLKNYLKYKI